jgi:hypothetical protein
MMEMSWIVHSKLCSRWASMRGRDLENVSKVGVAKFLKDPEAGVLRKPKFAGIPSPKKRGNKSIEG